MIAIICGGGQGVWDEASEAVELCQAAGVEVVRIACNDAGTLHPDPLHHWATLHPGHLICEPQKWKAKRAEAGLSNGYEVWSCTPLKNTVDHVLRSWSGGSSGFFAVGVAVQGLGLPAILCGVPMDDRANEFSGEPWAASTRYHYSWQKVERYGSKVRSMSGWTMELLGIPTVSWIRGVA